MVLEVEDFDFFQEKEVKWKQDRVSGVVSLLEGVDYKFGVSMKVDFSFTEVGGGHFHSEDARSIFSLVRGREWVGR